MKKTSLKALLGAGASAFALGAVAPAYAADLDAEPAAKEYVEVCPDSGFRGAILLPGTGVCFKVGGYAKADFIYTFDDFDGGIFNELLFVPGAFAGTGGDRAVFHARQSRFNFDARTTTDLGSARAFIELDIFNGGGNENQSNSANPRLRHAFVELGLDNLGGSLLAGQTWTNFGDLGSYANTLDFNGPNGQVFVRQAQVRWTQPLSDALTLSVAAENPEFLAPANVSGADNGLDAVPDFTLALKYRAGFGNLHFGALFRHLDVDNSANPGLSTDKEFGWGIQGAGTINIGERDKFRFQVNYGEGIGRYLQFAPAAALNDGGNLDAVEALGVIASYQHFWSDKLQSNAVFGYVNIDDAGIAGAVGGPEIDEYYAALNLIYSPRSNISLGIEGLYGRLENGAAEDDGFRIQSSIQFNF